MSKPFGLLLLFVALLAAGCGSETTPGDEHGDHHHHSGTGEHDHYMPGMDRPTVDGLYEVALYSDPKPTQGEIHELQLSITDRDGAALTNARVTVDVHMPDHGHGSDREPSVEETPGGVYAVGNVSLYMMGIWQIDITIEADAGVDAVSFRFDV